MFSPKILLLMISKNEYNNTHQVAWDILFNYLLGLSDWDGFTIPYQVYMDALL